MSKVLKTNWKEAEVEQSSQQESTSIFDKNDDLNLNDNNKNTRVWHTYGRQILYNFALGNVIIAFLCCTILVIYWGATYNTKHYYSNVKVLAVIENDIATENSILPMTNAIRQLIEENSFAWHVYDKESFVQQFMSNQNEISTQDISNRIIKAVYDEKYWFGFHVKPNMTNALYKSLTNDSAPVFNSTNFIETVYETGRDPSSVKSYMLPVFKQVEERFKSYYITTYLPSLLANISNPNFDNYENMARMADMSFNAIDQRRFTDRELLAPLQVGLIFGVILTVLQLTLNSDLHMELATKMKPKDYILYRIFMSYAGYFMSSLIFVTISAIFQVDFTLAFGKGGFVIAWLTTFLFLCAIGGANENMISLILAFTPQFMFIWLVSWIILNIAPSFFPLALANQFYRYGYMMPMHNAVDIFKIIFLDLSRSHMGRNYGILVAWSLINVALFPLVMKVVGSQMQKVGKLRVESILAKYGEQSETVTDSINASTAFPDKTDSSV